MARNMLFWITFLESDVRKISDVTGRQVESWEVAYFNGAAILDEIPVSNRDQTDQVVFRDRGGGGQSQTQQGQVGCSSEISLEFSHKFYQYGILYEGSLKNDFLRFYQEITFVRNFIFNFFTLPQALLVRLKCNIIFVNTFYGCEAYCQYTKFMIHRSNKTIN